MPVPRPANSKKRRRHQGGVPNKSATPRAPDEDEEQLTELLFGGGPIVKRSAGEGAETSWVLQEKEDEEHVVVDTVGTKESKEADKSDNKDTGKEKRPAWVDEDDEEVVINIATKNRLRKLRSTEDEANIKGDELNRKLREQFARVHSQAAWARLDNSKNKQKRNEDSEEEEEQDILFQGTDKLVAGATSVLPPDEISVTRAKDANRQDPSDAVVRSLEFHSNGQILLTGGLDKKLRLFQIDGTKNPKIQSIFVPDLPIYSAKFFRSGSEVILSGRRPYFYTYDIESGKVNKMAKLMGREENGLERFAVSPNGEQICFTGNNGYLLMVSGQTKQLIGTMKMNSSAKALCYSPDSQYIYSTGGDGDVYKWDVRTRRCVVRHHDEGSLHGTSIACDHLSKYYAVGSESGVVNIYDAANTSAAAKPLKAVMNVTTTASNVLFNHDSQIMAISSHQKKDSLKLVHLPSFRVFANWPTSRTPLRYVSSLAFSPNSGYMAIGNDAGKVLLYRLNSYSQA